MRRLAILLFVILSIAVPVKAQNPIITAAFNADDFRGAPTGTWTVSAQNEVTFIFTVIGKQMWVAFDFIETSVSGGPTILAFKIPGGYMSAGQVTNLCSAQSGTAGYTAEVQVSNNSQEIWIYRSVLESASSWPNSTGTTRVRGQIAFAIQ